MTAINDRPRRRSKDPRSACRMTDGVCASPDRPMGSCSAGVRQRGRSRLAYIFYVVVVSLAALEILLRVFDPIGIQYVYEIKRYFRDTVANDTFAYGHQPGYHNKLQGVDVATNSQGFRGPEFRIQKSAHTERILILGDSVVFGWGVRQDAIFPVLVQQLLRDEGEPVEVIPAGVCSWNTRTEYEFVRTVGVNYRPDVLVMVIVFNDIEPKKEGLTGVPKTELFPETSPKSFGQNAWEDVRRFLAKNSYFFSYLEYLWREALQQQSDGHVVWDDSRAWKDARLALDGLVELCAQQGISLIAYLYTSEADLPDDKILSLYKRHLEARGVAIFAMPSQVVSNPKYRNSVVDGHPNEFGHKLIAEHMAAVIREALSERRQARLDKTGG